MKIAGEKNEQSLDELLKEAEDQVKRQKKKKRKATAVDFDTE